MQLASFLHQGTNRYGAVLDSGIIDLTERFPNYPSLQDLIASDGLDEARRAVTAGSIDFGVDDVDFLPPILKPEKIWCIGVNYADRNAEYKDASDLPEYPSLFCRTPSSVVGHKQPIVRPRVSEQLDYEGEIVVIIGKEGRHIPREKAFDYIFGLSLCNEGSVRDWLRHGKFNVTQGKNFDQSGSIGPWITTSDALDPSKPVELTTRVNGEIRQQETTERMMFPFDYLLSYLSTFATLHPGDMIVTGTPTGAGVRHDPPIWLKPGDTVEVEVPEIGVLRNSVIDEQ